YLKLNKHEKMSHIVCLTGWKYSKHKGVEEMASEAPSWADQWGAGGFGAMEDDNTKSQNDAKMKNSGGKGGLSKARATASNCVKWFKSLCKRKTPTKQLG
ncbi:hypothetical protein KIW84_040178, partial [Lathyrus oleraceus]